MRVRWDGFVAVATGLEWSGVDGEGDESICRSDFNDANGGALADQGNRC